MAQNNIVWRANNTDDIFYISDRLTQMLYDEHATEANILQVLTAHNVANDVKAWQIPANNIYKAHNSIIFRSYAIKFAVGGVTPPAGAPSAMFQFIYDEYTFFIDITANGSKVELELADRNDNALATLEANEFNGVADFDVSSIVRTLFAKDMSTDYYLGNTAPERNCVQETYMGEVFRNKGGFFPEYNVNVDKNYFYMIVNGVGQYQGDEIIPRSNSSYNVLLGSGKVTEIGENQGKTNGYVSVLIPLEGTDTTYKGRTMTKGYVYNLLVGNAADATLVNAMLPTGQKNVSYTGVPECNDLLVRWINSRGGFDSFIFKRRQIRTTQVKTNHVRRSPYRRDTLLVIPEIMPYDITASRVLSVGQIVTKAELTRLEDMAISPYIEIFRAGNSNGGSSWVRVCIEKYDMGEPTDKNRFEFTADFKLPDLNTTMS